MCGWRHKFLSRAGKEILLKAVVQALPSYVMSVFALPLLLCADLERMMNSFWWGKVGSNRGCIRWKSWDKLCRSKVEGGLGFRKIHKFNMTLLAKQGWKFLTEPNSLVSQVIKARYYPHSNFLEAKIGANPSYVWRSIMATQSLIRNGVRKRIGSGSQTKIWGDPWLPDPNNPYIVSECVPELQQATVNSLRTIDDGAWDVDLVKEVFNERDQRLIFSIPLSRRDCEDSWMWGGDRKGAYTVKSGYKAMQNQSVLDPNEFSINWKFVWKLKLPAKVKNFMWRTLTSCLPTMTALKCRRVEVEEWCPLCHNEPEDDFHALVSCPLARQVWCLAPIGSNFGSMESVIHWWNIIVTRRNNQEVEIVATVMWTIWNNRNDVIWNGNCKSATYLFQSAWDLCTQWQGVNQPSANSQSFPHQHENPRWSKPPANYLKCNVDAAVFENPLHIGCGCIIRNSQGLVIKAIHGSLPGVSDPTIAEALGIREALSWIKEQHVSNIIVESDALL